MDAVEMKAGVSFIPVSDPMRPLDVFVWDARKPWHRKLRLKGKLVVALFIGNVSKGYQAWVVSDSLGTRVSSLPRILFDPEGSFSEAKKTAYRFAGYQPKRGLESLWLSSLEKGSELPGRKVSDKKVIASIVGLFSACFDIPEEILNFYDEIEKFERKGPFRRIV